MKSIEKNDVRPAAVADLFYPANRADLENQIETFLDNANPVDLDGEISALLSPHAGYPYSGQVAAAGYKLLQNRQYSVIAIISPSHRDRFPGISVFNGKGYETPLGLVAAASEFGDALVEYDDSITASWAGHGTEHAIEVQLPFLQKVLAEAPIIPIVMGSQDYDTCELLAEALATVLQGVPHLIIATSDLSHYHSYEEANKLDSFAIDLIESFDEKVLSQALEEQTCEACGGGPIIAAMAASKKTGADQIKVLVHQNSGDVGGDREIVVGYLSAAIYKARQ
ncbi:MAG: AmmeMemoRadiSam system protein B [bacterium]